jgi:hypothetical protein
VRLVGRSTLIQVAGEHTYSSRAVLLEALERVEGHTVIDLTACTYLDASVIAAIIGKALALGKLVYRLELVVPSSGSISQRFARLGVHNSSRSSTRPLSYTQRELPCGVARRKLAPLTRSLTAHHGARSVRAVDAPPR